MMPSADGWLLPSVLVLDCKHELSGSESILVSPVDDAPVIEGCDGVALDDFAECQREPVVVIDEPQPVVEEFVFMYCCCVLRPCGI